MMFLQFSKRQSERTGAKGGQMKRNWKAIAGCSTPCSTIFIDCCVVLIGFGGPIAVAVVLAAAVCPSPSKSKEANLQKHSVTQDLSREQQPGVVPHTSQSGKSNHGRHDQQLDGDHQSEHHE
jgi:hypothetical protein